LKFSLKHSMKWSIFISLVTFFLACMFSVGSTMLLAGLGWGIGMLVVFIIILIGIFFDIMGLASAAADELPFHAMASEKVKGAKQAIGIVRNADRFSNFCNDVIGDVCGVISGAATATVVILLLSAMGSENALIHTILSVFFAGLVSALTVGGKALGKSVAIHYANEIVLLIGKLFHFLEERCGLAVFNRRKNRSNGKRGKKHAS
jgi:CBS domain containing-hemolysin-like protein